MVLSKGLRFAAEVYCWLSWVPMYNWAVTRGLTAKSSSLDPLLAPPPHRHSPSTIFYCKTKYVKIILK